MGCGQRSGKEAGIHKHEVEIETLAKKVAAEDQTGKKYISGQQTTLGICLHFGDNLFPTMCSNLKTKIMNSVIFLTKEVTENTGTPFFKNHVYIGRKWHAFANLRQISYLINPQRFLFK